MNQRRGRRHPKVGMAVESSAGRARHDSAAESAGGPDGAAPGFVAVRG